MEATLTKLIRERLDEDESLSVEAGLLVLAACDGPAALDAALAAEELPEVPEAPPEETAASASAGAFLGAVTVEGFRGIGPRATLPLSPGPGLTLVVGRNGSGKSSFAEAIEILLTGDNLRWRGRVQEWRENWRNLHQAESTGIEVEFFLDGQRGPSVVRRRWEAGAALADARTQVDHPGRPRGTLDSLGWKDALVAYRPFLSYNELGSMLNEGPSTLYDALAPILGIEDLVVVQDSLKKAVSLRERGHKEVKIRLPALLERLGASSDPRALGCVDALKKKAWDLDVVEAVLSDKPATRELRQEVELLKRFSALEAFDAELVGTVVQELRSAAAMLKEIEGTDSAKARELASLLEAALAFHAAHPRETDCPVCRRSAALDGEWRARTEAEVAALRATAERAKHAHRAVASGRSHATRILAGPPEFVQKGADVGLDASTVLELWRELTAPPPSDNLEALADHLEQYHPMLSEAVADLKRQATDELRKREDAWRPLQVEVAVWVAEARAAKAALDRVPVLKEAEAWIRDASDEIRDERFAPISDQAMQTWRLLSEHSNVELGRIELARTGKQRRVNLDVTVDGVPGSALSVMSQGELHSLALSLFLPRATLPESPFRFIVVDDPVQSMDPSRVDGLARVLEAAAKRHQVVVFTHDARLPESVRRLDIAAAILEVRSARDPVSRYMDDARALILTDELPREVAARVVPGFCRSAMEAAMERALLRRWLGRGDPHGEIDQQLERATTLTRRAALVLFDDADRGKDVLTRLNRDYGRWAGDTLKAVDRGSHGADAGRLKDLVGDVERLSRELMQKS